MKHPDHVRLIRKGVEENAGGVWADFGSGDGAFTLALRDVAGPDVEIYSVDADAQRLANQKEQFEKQFPDTNIHFLNEDFTKGLNIPPLDGIIAANSIHYSKDRIKTLKHFMSFLKKQGKLIIVEYNVDEGNIWVPYPFSFPTLQKLAREAGLNPPKLLEKTPSSFLDEFYSAEISK